MKLLSWISMTTDTDAMNYKLLELMLGRLICWFELNSDDWKYDFCYVTDESSVIN